MGTRRPPVSPQSDEARAQSLPLRPEYLLMAEDGGPHVKRGEVRKVTPLRSIKQSPISEADTERPEENP